MSLGPKKVKRIVATNPIARSVAKQKLLQSMVNIKIRLYMTDEGERVQSIVQEISRLLVVTILACQFDKVTDYVENMDQALQKLCEISEDEFKWRKSEAFLVDSALDAVIFVTPKLAPVSIHRATLEVEKLEI